MNEKTINKLQLNEVKELVKEYCVSSLGKELINQLEPSGNIKVVRRRLAENKEAKNILKHNNHVPLEGLSNVTILLDKVDKGMILSAPELLQVQDFLRGSRKIKTFMLGQEFYAPTLSAYANNITECRDIESEIDYSIKGNHVDSEASKELKKIRRNIDVAEAKVKERMNKFLTNSSNKSYIQEFVISKRNDRYVVPIKTSFKNKVNGVVVDTSSKGNTVFMEPNNVAKFTVELVSLKSEEAIEEYKILSQLTELIYQQVRNIKLNVEVIAEYDMVMAKAKYSMEIGGNPPKVNNHGFIKIVNGKHPLLKGEVVPLNVEIGEDYRSLIITGPNAGGKTVALKTIGVLTLMTQCGFDIPADEITEMSIFEKVYVDIGDDQSIENALSTFSSHIKNIADIMSRSNKKTLILFDEIGSGTEPNEGAALAIAVLEEIYKMGAITVASTHYGEIKKYALLHPEFENAGMMFNKDTLQPLYQLTIGTSQDSNALFISKKMGIKNTVLEKAKAYMEEKNYDFQLTKKRASKIQEEDTENHAKDTVVYYKGDKVKLLEQSDFGIVYEPADKFNNVTVLYQDELVQVNAKRIELSIRATELYPEGYNLDELFTSHKDRKLDHDIQRGSKKALRKIQKEMRKS